MEIGGDFLEHEAAELSSRRQVQAAAARRERGPELELDPWADRPCVLRERGCDQCPRVQAPGGPGRGIGLDSIRGPAPLGSYSQDRRPAS